MNDYIPALWKVENQILNINLNSRPCLTELGNDDYHLSSHYQDYSVEIDIRPNLSIQSDRNFAYLYIDKNNWADIKMTGDTVTIQQIQNGLGINTDVQTKHYPFIANSWNKLKIDVSNSITLYIDGEQILQTNNVFYNNRNNKFITFQASTGALRTSSVSFDNLAVNVPDGTWLDVEGIKQFSEPWGELEYDSASEWSSSGTSFADWACYLTSWVMAMRYHGIDTMPDGSEVSPLSVNEWLKNNNGYINGGLVSNAMMSKLTNDISQISNTPSLEYSYIGITTDESSSASSKYAEEVKKLIDDNIPAILQIDGHFLIGHGYNQDISDIYIKDPAYERTLFSEHDTDLLSIRKLTPSYTDLRFLEIALPAGVTATLTDESGNPISGAIKTNTTIRSPRDNSTNAIAGSVIEYPKPNPGEYQLLLEGNTTTGIQIRSITTDGAVFTEEVSPSPGSKVNLHVSENGEAAVSVIPPTPTPTPVPTPTPTPVLTPSATPTPTATTTPSPTPSPSPSATPNPSGKPSLFGYQEQVVQVLIQLRDKGFLKKHVYTVLTKLNKQILKNRCQATVWLIKLDIHALLLVHQRQLSVKGYVQFHKALVEIHTEIHKQSFHSSYLLENQRS